MGRCRNCSDVGPITPPPTAGGGLATGHALPRAAVAFPRAKDADLLLDFVKEPQLIDFGSSVPGGDPGRAWKSEKGDYCKPHDFWLFAL